MLYPYDWKKAIFLDRPNRFIAQLLIDGSEVLAHVPNTGRMKELLVPGTICYCSYHPGDTRKTDYELRLVEYQKRLVSIDSQLPNILAKEALEIGFFGQFDRVTDIRREVFYGNSRIDLAFHSDENSGLLEAKGVTLIRDGWGYFPDAPTVRGTKHLQELINARQAGWIAAVVFVLQNCHGRGVSPNWETDPSFSAKLEEASWAGVRLFALKTHTNLSESKATGLLPVTLKGPNI